MVEETVMGDARLLTTDCLAGLATLPDASVQTCITSPPYWGLRDYGCDGQIGLEGTPDECILKMVAVFRAVRRVLRDDGTVWLNLGDSYSHGGGGARNHERWPKQSRNDHLPKHAKTNSGLKPKQLMGMPWRVALALQADGWYLRQDIIWHKPNPMPESIKDRCTKAHDYIFLLAKNAKYYYDQEAVLEPVSPNTNMRLSQNLADQIGSHRGYGGQKANGPMKAVGRKAALGQPGREKHNSSFDQSVCLPVGVRNKRSVWTVPTRSFSGAHFATFPPALIEPCVLAGCPPGGVVLDTFSGSGTTGMVALEQGRKYIGIELNPEYQELAKDRIAAVAGQKRMFA